MVALHSQRVWGDHHMRNLGIAIRARGEKLPTEFPNSMMRCICGVSFDSHKPAESYDHRGHIYAAQAKGAGEEAAAQMRSSLALSAGRLEMHECGAIAHSKAPAD
jgi:hypothetical protein